MHVILSLRNTPLEPLIRDALMAGATARVNSTTTDGTIALVEACALYLTRTQGVDDLKEVVNALLDSGAEPNAADEVWSQSLQSSALTRCRKEKPPCH